MTMRWTGLAGGALIVAGAFVLIRGGSFTSRRDVLKVGDVTMSAEQHYPINPWITGIAILAGMAVVAVSVRRKV